MRPQAWHFLHQGRMMFARGAYQKAVPGIAAIRNRQAQQAVHIRHIAVKHPSADVARILFQRLENPGKRIVPGCARLWRTIEGKRIPWHGQLANVECGSTTIPNIPQPPLCSGYFGGRSFLRDRYVAWRWCKGPLRTDGNTAIWFTTTPYRIISMILFRVCRYQHNGHWLCQKLSQPRWIPCNCNTASNTLDFHSILYSRQSLNRFIS